MRKLLIGSLAMIVEAALLIGLLAITLAARTALAIAPGD
jgi:hypothetical protein